METALKTRAPKAPSKPLVRVPKQEAPITEYAQAKAAEKLAPKGIRQVSLGDTATPLDVVVGDYILGNDSEFAFLPNEYKVFASRRTEFLTGIAIPNYLNPAVKPTGRDIKFISQDDNYSTYTAKDFLEFKLLLQHKSFGSIEQVRHRREQLFSPSQKQFCLNVELSKLSLTKQIEYGFGSMPLNDEKRGLVLNSTTLQAAKQELSEIIQLGLPEFVRQNLPLATDQLIARLTTIYDIEQFKEFAQIVGYTAPSLKSVMENVTFEL